MKIFTTWSKTSFGLLLISHKCTLFSNNRKRAYFNVCSRCEIHDRFKEEHMATIISAFAYAQRYDFLYHCGLDAFIAIPNRSIAGGCSMPPALTSSSWAEGDTKTILDVAGPGFEKRTASTTSRRMEASPSFTLFIFNTTKKKAVARNTVDRPKTPAARNEPRLATMQRLLVSFHLFKWVDSTAIPITNSTSATPKQTLESYSTMAKL